MTWHFSLGYVYEPLAPFIGFAAALMVFYGLAHLALTARFGESRATRAMAFGIGLALSTSMLVLDVYTGVSLAALWPFALIIVGLLAFIFFYELLKKAGQAVGVPESFAPTQTSAPTIKEFATTLKKSLATVVEEIRNVGLSNKEEQKKVAEEMQALIRPVEERSKEVHASFEALKQEIAKLARTKEDPKIAEKSKQFQDAELYEWVLKKVHANLRAAIEAVENQDSKSAVQSLMECFKAIDKIETIREPLG